MVRDMKACEKAALPLNCCYRLVTVGRVSVDALQCIASWANGEMAWVVRGTRSESSSG